MTKNEIIQFLRENPQFYLATSEDDHPRVRAIMLLVANKKGLVFTTLKHKAFYRQLVKNPKIEMCFYNPESFVQVRFSGTVEIDEDEKMQKLALKKFRFLKRLATTGNTDGLMICHLNKPKVSVWTLLKPFEEPDYFDF